MAQQIDSTKIGQLASQYAPDVPLELIGAVFKTESNYGSNPAAYSPNSSGAIGAGQILSKALGARYGNFEAYMPGGNPLDPEQSTIAALKKINADWRRSGDSIETFSKLYFGAGKDAAGNTALNHYVPKLLQAIQGQSNDQQYWNLVNGALGGQPQIDTGTPSNTLSENRLGWMMENGGPAKPVGNPSLAPVAVYASAATSKADQIVESISKSYNDLAEAKTGVDRAEANTKVELANQTEKLLSAMGLNLNDTGGQIAQTAQALQTAMGKLRADQEKLNQDRQNPIFAIFDLATNGKMSMMHRERIAQGASEISLLSKNIQELQAVGQKQIALQPKVSESAMEKEIQAKAKVYQTEAEINANKAGLQQEIRDERAATQAKIAEANLAIKTANLDIAAQRLALQQAQAAAPKSTSLTAQMKIDSQKAEEEMFVETATAMEMSPTEYVKFLSRNKDLAGYMVGADGKLPLPLVVAKANLGKLTPTQKKLFDSAFGQFAGWASPNGNTVNGIPGINYIPEGTEEAMKGAKTKVEKDAVKTGIVLGIAEKKRDFILNTGRPEDQEINPYTSNFDRVAEMSKLPEFVKANPIVDRVSKSRLYMDLQAENATNSLDKRIVSDEEVLRQAKVMIDSKQLTPAEAAKQVSDYYKAQVAMNNYAKQFKELGLPEQEVYPVPVSNDKQRLEFAQKLGKDGKTTINNYQMFDLTSEQKVTALLLLQGRTLLDRWATDPTVRLRLLLGGRRETQEGQNK